MAVTVGAGARTHGFLFADLRGYTAFVERNGDRAAARMLDTYRALVRAAVADHEGPEIRTEGDNVYVVFPSVGAAVACGLEIVRLAAESQAGGPDRAILVGVGVHAGETVETPEGFVGSAVNIAARVCAQAAAGEVLVTDTVRALTRTSLDVRFEPRGAPLLKGVGEAIALFAVQAGSLVTPPSERGRRNPYKGLRPFEERDSGDFFGREALTARLVERLADVMRAGRLLAIVGPSGSGKSSVVRAGLLPALRAGAIAGSDGWAVATMSPGSRPFSELAAALKRTAGSRLPGLADDLERDGDITRAVERALPAEVEQIALVIDQAEELFTLVHEPALRNRFVEGLLAASTAPASRLLVILTIRADLLDRPLAWPGFGELLRAGLEVVTPMSRAELELAIARPAQAAGVELEPGLAAEMIADVASAAEALPLLQYALTVLFDQSDGRRLTRQGYTAIGGVVGALGGRAEETWASLRPECRAVARRVLLRLVAAGEGGSPIGRRVLRADLGAGVVASNPSAAPEGDGVARAPLPSERDAVLVEEVLDAFGRCRLLAFDRDATTGEPTVEVAHEAVLTRWPRLVGWIEQQREDIWVRRRLDDAAAEWARAGYDEGFLLTGSRLQLFAGWARSTDLGLSPPEQTFLDASVASRQRHDQAETSRSTHEHALERQSRGRLRWLVAVLAAFSLVAGSLLVVVFGEGRAAEEQASIARARELAAASVSVLHADPRLSLLLAVEAARVTAARGYVVEQAMDSLHWALQAAPAGYALEDGPVAIRPGPAGAQGVYLLPPTQLIGLAQDRAGRSLTGSECATYLRSACPGPGRVIGPASVLQVYTARGKVPVGSLATASLSGTRVTAMLPAYVAPALAQFENERGISVVREDDRTDLATPPQGDLPDVAIVTRPSLVASLAAAGRAVELSQMVDGAALRSRLGNYLISLGTVASTSAGAAPGLFGAPVTAAVDDLVWYPTAAFKAAGYAVPTTWAGLMDLTRRMVADGRTPWCLGAAAAPVDAGGGDAAVGGAASTSVSVAGAAASGWVEDLLLSSAGPEAFARLTSGQLSFTDSVVRSAVGRFGQLAFGPGFVLGGSASIGLTPQAIAAWPLAEAPRTPSCWLYRGSGTERQSWPASVASAVAAFQLPPVDPAFATAVRGEVSIVVVFHDRPEVRQLVRWLLDDDFAAALDGSAGAAGVLSLAASGGTPIRDTVDGAQRLLLHQALQAGTFRVAGSGMLPTTASARFASSMLTYLADGGRRLDDILSELQERRGDTLASGSPASLQATVTFDGSSCHYGGPSVVPAGSRLVVAFSQDASREPTAVEVIGIRPGTTWRQALEEWPLSYALPPWAIEQTVTRVVSGPGTGSVDLAREPGVDGYIVACVPAKTHYIPASLIRVIGP